MPVLLVRHAQALSRSDWDDDDRLRPLSPTGHAQAAQLLHTLTEYKPTRVLSSPFVRCVDTVVPLAEMVGLSVETDDALAEGGDAQAVALVHSLMGEDAVLCSHGDVIPAVLAALDSEYRLGIGRAPRNAKASVWVLQAKRRRFVKASYIKAPSG